jgi:arylsulfatase A-like enzyme
MVARRPQADFLYCAMDRRWKLIYRPTHPELTELYDLQSDEAELHNVAAEHPDEVRRLLEELARRDGWVTEPFPMEGGGVSENALRVLQDLGYTDDGGGPAGEDAALQWNWVCPRDSHEQAGRGPCEQCGGPVVLRGHFAQ